MSWTQDNTTADSDDTLSRTCTGRCGDLETTIPCPPGTDPYVKCDPTGRQPPKVVCVPRGGIPPLDDDSDSDPNSDS